MSRRSVFGEVALRILRRVGFPCAVGLLVLVAAASYVRVTRFEKDIAWRAHTYEVLRHIELTQSALLAAESMRVAYRLSQDPRDRTRMDARIGDVSRELREVESLTVDNPKQQACVAALRPLVAERIDVLRDGLELPRFETLEPAAQESVRARQSHGHDLAKRIAARVDELRDEEQRLLALRDQSAFASAEAMKSSLVYGGAIALVLLGAIYASFVVENRARTRVQMALARSNALFGAVLEGTTDVIAVKDAAGRYLMINAAGLRQFGRAESDTLGKTDAELLDGGTGEAVMAADAETLREGRTRSLEHAARVGDRAWTIQSTTGPFRSADGAQLGVISVSRDITERKRLEEQLRRQNDELRALGESLRHQAVRDPLTNLFNRRYMDETLTREIARVKRRDLPLSVIMVDIDHFKRLNDTQGHAAGDEALRRVAATLLRGVRREDAVARYGGEEFALILPDLSLEGAVAVAERLRKQIASLDVALDGVALGPLTASFGVASLGEHGEDGEALVRAADGALYEAKRFGRNRVVAGGLGSGRIARAAS